MNSEKFFELIADLDESKVYAAGEMFFVKTKPMFVWMKRIAVAACLCVVFIFGLYGLGTNGGSFFGNGDKTLLEVHREDFDSVLNLYALKLLNNDPEIKKAYIMLNNEWFLSDELTDFSQILTTEEIYVRQTEGLAYSFFRFDENGEIGELASAFPPDFAKAPFGFGGLTYEMIEESLSEIKYDDYVIAYSQHLKTVFIWARSGCGDVIVTYPTRPDLLGLQIGKAYALEEIQGILTDVYEKSSVK